MISLGLLGRFLALAASFSASEAKEGVVFVPNTPPLAMFMGVLSMLWIFPLFGLKSRGGCEFVAAGFA